MNSSPPDVDRNHPFVVYTSTRHLKGQVPRSYLQNSYKICTINAHWIVSLLKDMERSRISLYDPFLGYLVTIAATIHLDKSLRKDDERARSARRQDFQLCRDFIQQMALMWPSMVNVVSKTPTLSHAGRSHHSCSMRHRLTGNS